MSDSPVFIGGHSLGGADAYEYAFSRLVRGLRVDGIFPLAPARPGNRAITARFRATRGLAIRAIANRGDPIPGIPLDMAFINENYEQPWPLEAIDEAPPAGSDVIFGRHKVALYVAGCAKLPQGDGPIPLSRAAHEIARLYDDPTNWSWINPVDGLYWAMITINGARLMLRRGSQTKTDWFREDFNAVEIPILGARMSRGFWMGVGPVEEKLDAALA
jgi:pimeloyl-ACP methyl ester carboxylesterase